MTQEFSTAVTKFLVESGANAKTTGIIIGTLFPTYAKENYKLPRQNIQNFVLESANKITNSDLPILDLGCGRRNYKNLFSQALDIPETEIEYVAIDHFIGSDDMYKKSGPNVVGSVSKIPLSSESVGVVVCTEVLEHVANDGDVLKEIARVLRQNGKLILTVPGKYIPKHDKLPYQVDYRRYTEVGLSQKLIDAGFSNIIISDRCFNDLQINIFANAVKK